MRALEMLPWMSARQNIPGAEPMSRVLEKRGWNLSKEGPGAKGSEESMRGTMRTSNTCTEEERHGQLVHAVPHGARSCRAVWGAPTAGSSPPSIGQHTPAPARPPRPALPCARPAKPHPPLPTLTKPSSTTLPMRLA